MIPDLLASRRSVRRFRPEAPPRETVEHLLRAATLAPSASNAQPWRFVAVADRALVAALAGDVRAAVEALAAAVPPPAAVPVRRYAAYFSAFAGAPVLVAVLWRPTPLLSHLACDEASPAQRARVAALEESSALMGASLAVGHLLLAAHAEGLGACCMTGPLLAEEALRARLPVQPGWRVAAFVPLGYPDEHPPPTPRKPLHRLLTWIDDEGSHHGP